MELWGNYGAYLSLGWGPRVYGLKKLKSPWLLNPPIDIPAVSGEQRDGCLPRLSIYRLYTPKYPL